MIAAAVVVAEEARDVVEVVGGDVVLVLACDGDNLVEGFMLEIVGLIVREGGPLLLADRSLFRDREKSVLSSCLALSDPATFTWSNV